MTVTREQVLDYLTVIAPIIGEHRMGCALCAHDGLDSAVRQLNRIAAMKPKTILEVGTGTAATTGFLARLAKNVVSLDIGPWAGRDDLLDAVGVKNVSLIRVWTDEQKIRLCRELQYDLAFLDGWHEGDGPRIDFEATRHCGAVLCHDMVSHTPNGVSALIRSLPADEVQIDEPFAWWIPNGRKTSWPL